MRLLNIYSILLGSRVLAVCSVFLFVLLIFINRNDITILWSAASICFFSFVDSVTSIIDPKAAKEVPDNRFLALFFTASFHCQEETDRSRSIMIGSIIFMCLIGVFWKLFSSDF